MNKIEEISKALSELSGIDWKDLLPEAKAVIEAMREPNKEMIEAGQMVVFFQSEDYGISDVWQAMIDAAMEEE